MESISEQLIILIDLAIAALLSGIVGFEGEKLDKPAGLKTYIIVGTISCFFVSLSQMLSGFLLESDLVKIEPVRILQASIVSVSVIGAGTILKSKHENTVNNLTTAVSLLYSSGIGISVALQLYVTAIGSTLLIIIINSLRYIEKLNWIAKSKIPKSNETN